MFQLSLDTTVTQKVMSKTTTILISKVTVILKMQITMKTTITKVRTMIIVGVLDSTLERVPPILKSIKIQK